MRRALVAALALLAVLGVVACDDDSSDSASGGSVGAELTVLGAASLTEVLPKIDPAARYSFAGSDALAAQIREGAPADVFAAANTKLPDALNTDGLVEKPVVFATNTLVIVVPKGNPKDVKQVSDLDGGGVRYVLADEGVPVGDYTREVLDALGQSDLVDGAASLEPDVRDVLTKVTLGEADAGFVYATDAATATDDVTVVPIPEKDQPPVRYGIAVVSASEDKEAAQAFVDKVTGPEGDMELEAAGFGIP